MASPLIMEEQPIDMLLLNLDHPFLLKDIPNPKILRYFHHSASITEINLLRFHFRSSSWRLLKLKVNLFFLRRRKNVSNGPQLTYLISKSLDKKISASESKQIITLDQKYSDLGHKLDIFLKRENRVPSRKIYLTIYLMEHQLGLKKKIPQ